MDLPFKSVIDEYVGVCVDAHQSREANMTQLEKQQIAVSMAVRAALYNIGYGVLRSGEFFGTNQKVAVEEAKAA